MREKKEIIASGKTVDGVSFGVEEKS